MIYRVTEDNDRGDILSIKIANMSARSKDIYRVTRANNRGDASAM